MRRLSECVAEDAAEMVHAEAHHARQIGEPHAVTEPLGHEPSKRRDLGRREPARGLTGPLDVEVVAQEVNRHPLADRPRAALRCQRPRRAQLVDQVDAHLYECVIVHAQGVTHLQGDGRVNLLLRDLAHVRGIDVDVEHVDRALPPPTRRDERRVQRQIARPDVTPLVVRADDAMDARRAGHVEDERVRVDRAAARGRLVRGVAIPSYADLRRRGARPARSASVCRRRSACPVGPA